MEIRNIAIIAHVDHGKTTLVNKMIELDAKVSSRIKKGDSLMDNNALEKERGITIVSKNVSVSYKNTKINIIDTPGHSDFGGEVERVLNMADGVCLLVDAFEGPMPQTRFVLQKAILLGLNPILVVNKVDKENCKPEEVYEKVFELMIDLGANDEQLEFPVVYGSSKRGWMSGDYKKPTEDITYLLDVILKTFKPAKIEEGNTQLLITSLDFSSFVGRIAIGKLNRGILKENQPITLCKRDNKMIKARIKELYSFEGVERIKISEAVPGDIVAISGIDGFEIGDTIADYENPEPLKSISVDEPTMSMVFAINDSPFFGKEGKFSTSRHIQERLTKELEKNLALRVENSDLEGKWNVHGRGVLHLSILIETMRREGYEFQVGQPKVILKKVDGELMEPIEELTVDVPEIFSGTVIDFVTKRKGEMLSMEPKGSRMVCKFHVPSRGLIGMRTNMLSKTQGEAVVTHRFIKYDKHRGEIKGRINGSLINMETGTSIAYSLHNLQDRGIFFVDPGEAIYEGQVIGENNKQDDLVVSLTKTKKLTNMRATGTDEKMKIAPAQKFSLEEALEYIQEDEYVEVTPLNIRMRKIILNRTERERQQKRGNN